MSAPAKPILIYGVNGDGRGHAARAIVLAPYLREHFQLVFHTSQDALVLLRQCFKGHDDIRFLEIPGTHWVYGHQGISPWRSVLHFLFQVLWLFPREARKLMRWWRESPPVGVISDLEPVVARAAAMAGLPLVALSHQHAMAMMVPSRLGMWPIQQWIYRLYAWLNTPQFRALVISSFFQLPLRRQRLNVLVVGGLIRPECLRLGHLSLKDGGAPLAYLRKGSSYRRVLIGLQNLAPEAVVFGLNAPPGSQGILLEFRPVDPIAFLDCLGEAPYLVAAAGHQLLCEAMELKKPVLALYERAHDEQRLNARMWEQLGYGMAVEIEEFHEKHLQKFINSLPIYRHALDQRIGARDNAETTANWILHQLTG